MGAPPLFRALSALGSAMVDSPHHVRALSTVLGMYVPPDPYEPDQALPAALDSDVVAAANLTPIISSLSAVLLSSAAAHALPGTHGPGQSLPLTLDSAVVVPPNLTPRIPSLSAILGSAAGSAPPRGRTILVALHYSAVLDCNMSRHSSRSILVLAAAQPRTVLAASAADSPLSTNGPSQSPGQCLLALCSCSVAARLPPSIHGPSHAMSTLGVAVPYATHRRLYAKTRHPTRRIIIKRSSHKPCVGAVDGGPGDSTNGSGLAVGTCTTFADPSGLGEACASDDSTGACHVSKYFFNAFSISSSDSPARFPTTAVTSLGICIKSTHG